MDLIRNSIGKHVEVDADMFMCFDCMCVLDCLQSAGGWMSWCVPTGFGSILVLHCCWQKIFMKIPLPVSHANTHTHLRTHVCTCSRTCARAHAPVCTHACIRLHAHTHAHTHICTQTYTRRYARTHTRLHTHSREHLKTYTCIPPTLLMSATTHACTYRSINTFNFHAYTHWHIY